MKINRIYEELTNIISLAGIIIRKDILKSKGGYCILEDNKLIILNKILPLEIHCRILACCIGELDLLNSGIFISPVIREYIENEIAITLPSTKIEISLKEEVL